MIHEGDDAGQFGEPPVKPIAVKSEPQSRRRVEEVGGQEGLADGGAGRGRVEVGVGETPSAGGLVDGFGDGEEGAEGVGIDVLGSTVFGEG